jgi:protein-S-isoprenylcysteine O-methyltransferase
MNRNLMDKNLQYIHSVSLSFVPVACLFVLTFFLNFLLEKGTWLYLFILVTLFIATNVIALVVLSSIVYFSVYWRSCLLSNLFLIGLLFANQTSAHLVPFGYYLMCLSFFHLSEYVFTALFNSNEVTTDSFLLNHSLEYGVAALASWLEFFLELLVFPSLKLSLVTRALGLGLVIVGEMFRKLAMYTAGTSFNHYVQERRRDDHVLVTSGVYALARHPSYFGWFLWSIGTQVLLANPLCTVAYTVASWKFFKARITYEEFHLIKFFGKQYTDYQRRVWSGIPFVRGFLLIDESLD